MFADFLLFKVRVFVFFFFFFFFFFFHYSIHPGGTPFEPPPHQSKVLGKEGAGGGITLLQKGFPPPVISTISFQATGRAGGNATCRGFP